MVIIMKVKARKITDERAAELVLQLHKTGKFVPDCGHGHRPKKPICNLKNFLSTDTAGDHLLNFHI